MPRPNKLIIFEYRSKDGVLEDHNCVITLFTDEITISGEKRKRVFDPVKIGPVFMRGLYISYRGIEYGSITTTLQQLLIDMDCNCEDGDFRLFENLFDFEFE